MIRRLFAVAATLLLSVAVQAETLIDNVNGMTFSKDGSIQRFSGLVIADDGRVKQLLDRKDKRPKNPQYYYDAKGMTLMPGFVDAHGHVMGTGFGALTLDLSATRSLEEALQLVRDYAARHPSRPWIIGRGWNQELWGLGRFPTAAELDRAVADRPVWLERVDGHAGWANSAAMAAAGITAATVSPPGGYIEKQDRQPTGVFVDNATSLIAQVVPEPRAVERDLALAKAQEIFLAGGVTTMTDMGTTMADWQSLRRAGDKGQLRMRFISYAAEIEEMTAIAGPEPTPWLYDSKLRMVGVKLYLDGALGSRGAWLKRPYQDAPASSGLPLLNSAQLRNKMSRAAMDGFQLAVHAIGDAANEELLSGIEEMRTSYQGDRRWRIEHAQILDPTDIPRIIATGSIASMQPVHQTSDRAMAEARLGPDRLRGAYAWRTIVDAGGVLAFGTDVPVERVDPFAGLAAAISRSDAMGEPFGGWQPQEKIGREEAIRAYTIGAAFAGMAEDRIGSLEPGKYADFILLDTDPLLAGPYEMRSIRVQQTWVGGSRAYVQPEIAR